MLRTPFSASSFRRRSISRTALRKAFDASLGSVMIGRMQVRHSFVIAQFQSLGIDQYQLHLVGRRLVEHRHDEGVDGHALARSGRTCDQQMRHGVQIGGNDAAVDVLAQRQRELRLGAEKLAATRPPRAARWSRARDSAPGCRPSTCPTCARSGCSQHVARGKGRHSGR